MKKRFTIISITSLVALSLGVASCDPGVYTAKKTGYFQREQAKYRMLDTVVDCPQFTVQRANMKRAAKGGKKKKFLGLF